MSYSHDEARLISDSVVFHGLPKTVYMNEDFDSSYDLWAITTECHYSTARWACPRIAGATCPIITNHTEPCTECFIASNPDPALFYIDGKQV